MYEAPSMSLYIDGREESKHGWAAELRREGIDAKPSSNLPADFIWQSPAGLILVERKTWSDFVASFTGSGGADAGNRLVGQLLDGPKSAAVRILFMEGPMPAYTMAGSQTITADAMDDASLSVQWQGGVLFAHSLNHDHTAHRLATLYRYTQKEDHASLLRPTPPIPEERNVYLNPEFRKKIAAFMTVPQFGEKGALILAQETESPLEAVNLSHKELMAIAGIGKLKARLFYDFWRKW